MFLILVVQLATWGDIMVRNGSRIAKTVVPIIHHAEHFAYLGPTPKFFSFWSSYSDLKRRLSRASIFLLCFLSWTPWNQRVRDAIFEVLAWLKRKRNIEAHETQELFCGQFEDQYAMRLTFGIMRCEYEVCMSWTRSLPLKLSFGVNSTKAHNICMLIMSQFPSGHGLLVGIV